MMMRFFSKKNTSQTQTNPNNDVELLKKQLNAVLEVSQSIVGIIDIEKVLELVTTHLGKNLGYKFPAIFLLDHTSSKLVTRKLGGVNSSFVKLITRFFGRNPQDIVFSMSETKNIMVRSVVENKFLTTTNLHDFTRPFTNKLQAKVMQKALDTELMIAVPLSLQNKAIGVLGASYKKGSISVTERTLLETFANQITIAIVNGQLFNKVQQQVVELTAQAKDLSALHDLSSIAGSSLKKRSVMQALLDQVPEKLGHLGVGGASVLLRAADANLVQAVAFTQSKFTQPVIDLISKRAKTLESVKADIHSSEILQAVFEKRQPQMFHQLSEAFPSVFTPRMDAAVKKMTGTHSNVLYPIMSGNAVQGVVLLNMTIPVEKISSHHNEILQVFVNHLAGALENADLFERLAQQYKTVENQTKELALANQRLRTLDRTKSEFISIASHQLRTPLTVIRGYLSLLQEGTIGNCDQEALNQIGKIMRSTERLVSLVNDLLDISRIERGTMTFDMKPMRLEDLAKDVFDEFAIEAKQKGLEFRFVGPRLPTPPIPMDSQKLRQTIINLIDNAIKYTEKGSVVVSIKRAGGEIRLYVTDTGIGLSEDMRANLFQKFIRGEGVSQVNTEGLGLGLYVAKQIVTHHNGIIWADSLGKGSGSTFAFSLKIPRRFKK